MRKLILILGCSLFVSAHAEIYMGMKPDSTLGEIKKMFPNALIAKVDAAWVTEADGFYRMTGNGLSGEIYLAFSDGRPRDREHIAFLEDRITKLREGPQTGTAKSSLESHLTILKVSQELASRRTDEALKLKWVRWIPVTPIPVARYVTKYGPPTKTGFNDDDMRPYSAWPAKGVLLQLSDDGKTVAGSEFTFTAKETRDQCMAQYKVAAICD